MDMKNVCTGSRFRKQIFFKAQIIFFYQSVGAIQNLGSRTVILIQDNSFCSGMVFVKVYQKFNIGTAPLINILVRVSDNHKVLILAGKNINKLHFNRRRILKLINLNIVQPFLPFIADFFVISQKVDCIHHQVGKIE